MKKDDALWFYSMAIAVFCVLISGLSAYFGKELLEGIPLERLLFFIGIVGFIFGFYILKRFSQPLFRRNELLDFTLKETLHELNIPIATIKANAQMIKKLLQDEASLKRLERIEKATENLIAHYKELDYYIRQEIGGVEMEAFSAKEVIIESLSLFENKIEATLDDGWLNIDKIGFERVIKNLIQNSIKYSKNESEIVVIFKDGLLEVHDSGMGMDEVTRLKALEQYYQGSNSSEGYGIGLSFVGNFCASYNLPLKIESKKDVGTRVFIDFRNYFKR